MSDGLVRENASVVCKMFYNFKYNIPKYKDPAKFREVRQLKINKKYPYSSDLYSLVKYGHLDIIKLIKNSSGMNKKND